jgi:TPR repeat protein
MSVPIKDFTNEHEGLAKVDTEVYYPCCGKSVCRGCVHSFSVSGNRKCPFCNADRAGKTDEEDVEEMMKRVEANDPASICMLANYYEHGRQNIQQDQTKAMELYSKAADLGCSRAHSHLADIYRRGRNMKKAKFHLEAAAMAGLEVSRCIVGYMEHVAGNVERAVKHWTIAASAGCFNAMHELRLYFENGSVSRESIDSILTAYNSSCAEMRSEARDAAIQLEINII